MIADLCAQPTEHVQHRRRPRPALPPPIEWPHVLDTMPAHQLWLRGLPFPAITTVSADQGASQPAGLVKPRPPMLIVGRHLPFAHAVGPFPDPAARPVPLLDGWILTGTTAIPPAPPARRPRHMPVIQQRGHQSDEVLDELVRLGVGIELTPHERAAIERLRPKTRGDCVDGPRPCPWISCKYHLFVDVSPETGSIKFNYPGRDPGDLTSTCALDIADEGETALPRIAQVLGISMERVRQIIDGIQRQHAEGHRGLDPRRD